MRAQGASVPGERWASERRLFAGVFLLAAVLASPYPGANENRTLDLVHALARGTLTIDAEHANTGDKAYVPGRPSAAALELGFAAAPESLSTGGHYYCGGAPGLAFALLPAYAATHPTVPFTRPAPVNDRLEELWLVLVGAALPFAVGTIGVRRAVLRACSCDPDMASGAALVHALATIALPFATRLFAHSLVVALFAWALALLLRRRTVEGEPRAAAAGLLAALAVCCDYNVALEAALLGVLALARGGVRGAVLFALGTLPAAVALGAYHRACFGSPFATPYDFHWDGSIVATLHQGSYGFTYPRPRLVAEVLFGRRRGFLCTQPAALVGLVGLVCSARRSGPHRLALAAAVTAVLANASRSADWDAGSCFGARYTTVALPFLALGLPSGVELLGRAGRAIVAASGVLTLVGATSSWGYSIETNFDCIWFVGPRLGGAVELVLGIDPRIVDERTVLVSAVGLSLVLPLLWLLVARRRPEPAALVGTALVPWCACLPVAAGLFLGGPDAALQRYERVIRRESERAIHDARDADEMRRLVWHVLIKSEGIHAHDLYLEALDRMVELDPDDAEMRAKRDRLRARLRSEADPRNR
jgi:hypothetical protein